MSWAAHDLEPYAIQRHMRLRVAFVPLLLGSYSPDMMSKWFVYGIHLGPWELKAHNPAQFHRGWPGLGFTHSLLYGVVIGLLLWKGAGSKTWGVSFMIGQWAHALTDTGDTVGTMLFFRPGAHSGLRRTDVLQGGLARATQLCHRREASRGRRADEPVSFQHGLEAESGGGRSWREGREGHEALRPPRARDSRFGRSVSVRPLTRLTRRGTRTIAWAGWTVSRSR